jgi:cell division GTPase FtsZ
VPLRIDRFDLWRSGAHAIRLTGKAPVVTTARGQQGLRPWTVVPKPYRFEIKPNSRNPQRSSEAWLPQVR